MIVAATPTINCNVAIKNISMQSSETTQGAEANLNSNMTSQISNTFESEIDKQINQTNKDLNFMQFNSSDERTALSQSIRNDINNSIANVSKNISTTYLNGKQTINFINDGIINCSGCGQQSIKTAPSELMTTETFPSGVNDGGQCTLLLENSNIQKANTDQKANSALTSIFNNAVANDLTSKYKLAVSQTNTGVNLMELLLSFILPILIILIVCGLVGGYLFKNSKPAASSSESTKPIWIAFAIVIVIGAIFVMILAVSCQLPPYNWPPNVCPKINSTSSPSPSPSPKPQDPRCPNGFKCVYPDLNTCNTETNNQCHPNTTYTPTLYCGAC
jgi:hypothetical protein